MKPSSALKLLAALLGVQASFSMANAFNQNLNELRLVEDLSAKERFYLKQYLLDLQSKGFVLDLKNNTIAIDSKNQVYLIDKSSAKSLMRDVEEPSCMSGGTN